VFGCVCVRMYDTGQNRGSKYRWISGKLYIIEPVVVLTVKFILKVCWGSGSRVWNRNASLLWLSQEYVLLNGGNVTAGNTERLAWCAVTSQWWPVDVISICVMCRLWIHIMWNEKIPCCASIRRNWWTVGQLGECSVIPGQVEISSCLSHAAEFFRLFYFVITWRLF